jgi:hypothetical protein
MKTYEIELKKTVYITVRVEGQDEGFAVENLYRDFEGYVGTEDDSAYKVVYVKEVK